MARVLATAVAERERSRISIATTSLSLSPETCSSGWRTRASKSQTALGKNAYDESFNSRLLNELLDCEVFTAPTEAKVLGKRVSSNL